MIHFLHSQSNSRTYFRAAGDAEFAQLPPANIITQLLICEWILDVGDIDIGHRRR